MKNTKISTIYDINVNKINSVFFYIYPLPLHTVDLYYNVLCEGKTLMYHKYKKKDKKKLQIERQ